MGDDDRVLNYGGGWLDRAGVRRSESDWVIARLNRAESRLVPLWQDRSLTVGENPTPVWCTVAGAGGLVTAGGDVVFLGLDAGEAVFAVDLSDLPEQRATALAGADATLDVRSLAGRLPASEAAVQGYARGILHWHRHQRFCGTCGGRTEIRNGGHARACTRTTCARSHFPRIEPAVIVLVEAPGAPDRCLLARHAGAGEDSYSLLAGFVEVGESLEDAVRREVAEETGVEVGEVTYQASQAWPFPAGLMVGFRAVAQAEQVRVDGEELLEARWFTRKELLIRAAEGRLGRADSIDRHILHGWLTVER